MVAHVLVLSQSQEEEHGFPVRFKACLNKALGYAGVTVDVRFLQFLDLRVDNQEQCASVWFSIIVEKQKPRL